MRYLQVLKEDRGFNRKKLSDMWHCRKQLKRGVRWSSFGKSTILEVESSDSSYSNGWRKISFGRTVRGNLVVRWCRYTGNR